MFKKITAMLMVIVLSAGVGYAAGNGKSITVYYDTIKKIMIDNQDKTPTDVKPFIYEGTTYVPLRYISEQLGKPVYFDNTTQIIYIGSRPKTANIQKKDLFSLSSDGIFNPSVYRYNNSILPMDNLNLDTQFSYTANYKMTYKISSLEYEEKTRGLNTKVYNGETAYLYKINKEYDALTGMVGYDGTMNPKIYPCTINIVVDDVVRQQIKLNSTHTKEAINANLTGGMNFKIQMLVDNYVKIDNKLSEPFLNLTDMTLEKITYQ